MSHSTEPFPLSHARIGRAGDASCQPAAFQGAFNALSTPRFSAKQLTTTHSGQNGELATADFAGMGKQRPTRTTNEEKSMYEKTDSFRAQRPLITTISLSQRASTSTSSQKREEPKHSKGTREQSPSSIAALIPDTKFPPPIDVDVSSESALRKPFTSQKPPSAYMSSKQHTDLSPILATTTLVKLFESQSGRPSPPPNTILSRAQKSVSQTLSPIPTAHFLARTPAGVLRSTEHAENAIESNKFSRARSREMPSNSPSSAPVAMTSSVVDPVAAQPKRSNPTISITGSIPTPPPPRRTRQDFALIKQKGDGRSSFTNDSDGSSSASSYASAADKITVRAADSSEKGKPFVYSTRPKRPSEPVSRGSDKDGSTLVGGRISRDGLLLPRRLAPQLTADSLANAMVASSLASSRAPSPSKPPLPPPRRNTKQHSIFRRSQSQDQAQSRTPSPGRSMRQTMRKSPKPDDEDEYSRKKGGYLLKKHHNKHHEGDRKRWRDEITEQERKRYEGVWAANKGLLMSSEDVDSAGTVLNLVVRDIWRRCHLPDDVLEDVWNLVDIKRVGRLRKEEFVVGMWLIDQRLKGRKLPMRVSESVWFSARALSGVKVLKSHR